MSQLLTDWADVYDADPLSLPLPSEAPAELPLVILARLDQSERLELARARANLYWTRQGDIPVDYRTVLGKFAERLARISESNQIPVGRLAAILTRTAERPSPGYALAQQYCKAEWLQLPNGPLSRPEGFELHAHKTYSLADGARINSWMRIRTAKAVARRDYHLIAVQQDLNTLAEELTTRRFSPVEITEWFKVIGPEFDSIMLKYFPDAGDVARE